MAIAASHRYRIPLVGYLREIFGIDVPEHSDHHPRSLLGGALVGDKIDSLRTFCMTKLTLHAKLLGIPSHQLQEIGLCDIGPQDLEISYFAPRRRFLGGIGPGSTIGSCKRESRRRRGDALHDAERRPARHKCNGNSSHSWHSGSEPPAIRRANVGHGFN
jgi:hypothetical protein